MKKIALKPGEALVLRTCAADMTSHNGFTWPKKGLIEAPDWKSTKGCGNGLHGFLWGEGDASLASSDEDAKWLVCKVQEKECIDLKGKVKFPRAEVVYVGPREKAVGIIQAHAPSGKRVHGGGRPPQGGGGSGAKCCGGGSGMNRAKLILIALDQLLNTICNGWPDETLSSRCWRWELAGKRSWPRKVVDRVFGMLGDKNHCRESYESERLGRQLPPEMRRP